MTAAAVAGPTIMPDLRSEAGFTIIEVLVTALIVAVMSTGIALGLESSAGASGDQRMRAEGDALAAQDQERMRGLSDEQLAALGGSGQHHLQTLDGAQFTINSSTAAVTQQGASSCGSDGASEYRITSTVSWAEVSGGANDSVAVNSLMARPTTGDLLTVIDDQAGNALPGVSVATISGPSSQSGTTDANGCSLFAGLTPGAYKVQFSKSGYVDPSGSASPSFATTVSATGTPPTNKYTLGLGGTIAATFATSNAAVGEATALSYSNTGNATAKATTPGAAMSSITSPLLYPVNVAVSGPASYQNNYTIWAGACPQQVPVTPTTASVGPGSTQSVTVDEPELVVPSVVYHGLPVTPSAFKLTFASVTGTTCTDSWSAAPATAKGINTPPTSGWLADPGQPYADGTSGQLSVCASYQTPLGQTVSGTTTAVNSSVSAPNLVSPIPLTSSGGC